MNALLQAALGYAARGWPVLPVRPGGKAPLSAHGLNDATCDGDQVRQWWKQCPTANIGIRTGVVCDVFDIDAWPDGGLQFDGTRHGIAGRQLACGPSVTTANDKMHLYFATPHDRPIRNKVRFIPGCDWRGAGGYVIAPPSLLAGNEYAYSWRTDADVPLEPVDAWLLDLLDPPRQHVQPTSRPRTVGSAYARAALTEECRIVAGAPPGTRNDTLCRSAFNIGQLIAEGALDAEESAGYLLGAALASGLPEAEARRTLGSGLQAGATHPRRVA